MCDPVLVTVLKMQLHDSQSSYENATPSSGTSPLASYHEEPPSFPGLQLNIRIMCILCTPRPTYQSTYRPTDVLVDISAKCRSICRSTYRSSVGRYVDRDVSLDILADISVEHRPICPLTLDRYVGRYVDREWLSDYRPTCRLIGYRHSTYTSLLLSYWWL